MVPVNSISKYYNSTSYLREYKSLLRVIWVVSVGDLIVKIDPSVQSDLYHSICQTNAMVGMFIFKYFVVAMQFAWLTIFFLFCKKSWWIDSIRLTIIRSFFWEGEGDSYGAFQQPRSYRNEDNPEKEVRIDSAFIWAGGWVQDTEAQLMGPRWAS